MRRIVGLAVGVWVLCGIGIAGVRGFAQQAAAPPDIFPLPEAHGCWQDVCFFALSTWEVVEALDAHPLVAQMSAPTQVTNYQLRVRTGTDANPQRVTGVIVSWSRDAYVFAWDWTFNGNPPLMTVGDLVRELGAPQRVSVGVASTELWYGERAFSVALQPAATGYAAVRLAPDDVITRITAPNMQYGVPNVLVDPATSEGWHGFGAYEIR